MFYLQARNEGEACSEDVLIVIRCVTEGDADVAARCRVESLFRRDWGGGAGKGGAGWEGSEEACE